MSRISDASDPPPGRERLRNVAGAIAFALASMLPGEVLAQAWTQFDMVRKDKEDRFLWTDELGRVAVTGRGLVAGGMTRWSGGGGEQGGG